MPAPVKMTSVPSALAPHLDLASSLHEIRPLEHGRAANVQSAWLFVRQDVLFESRQMAMTLRSPM